MATITASISLSQGSDPSELYILDDTINEDTQTYTSRTLTILDSNNEALPDYPNPNSFSFSSYPTNIFTISGLTVDVALSVTMLLVPTVVDPSSDYEVTEEVATNRFLQQGVYNIQEARFIENQLVGLASVQAQLNSIDIIIEQQNSQTSVLYGSLTGAQNALTRGQNIIDSQVL